MDKVSSECWLSVLLLLERCIGRFVALDRTSLDSCDLQALPSAAFLFSKVL